MKRLVIAASVALIAGMGAANAASLHHKKARAEPKGPMIQRNVGLGLDPAVPRANSDLKYGPQPGYPQSPPGGGY